MSTPHLEQRWIEANGELAEEPRTAISVEDDIALGLAKFARVFRPGRVDRLSIHLEGWEDDIHVRWGWKWDPASFVGGVAYRYSFDGAWNGWSVDHSYGFTPGHRPRSEGLGISMKIQKYGVLFQVEVVLLGMCCMSRGPVTTLSGWIPKKDDIPQRQPALLLNEMLKPDE